MRVSLGSRTGKLMCFGGRLIHSDRGMVAVWWCSVPSIRKVAGSTPPLAAT